MGRRSGDQTHQYAAPPPRDSLSTKHTKAIGLSTRFRDQNPTTKVPRPSKAQRATERAHARYPFSGATVVLSAVVIASVLLACIYWISFLNAPPQQQ